MDAWGASPKMSRFPLLPAAAICLRAFDIAAHCNVGHFKLGILFGPRVLQIYFIADVWLANRITSKLVTSTEAIACHHLDKFCDSTKPHLHNVLKWL